MLDMNTLALVGPISHLSDYSCWITLLVLILGSIGGAVGLFFLFKRVFPRVFIVTLEVGGILSWLFGLDFLAITCIVFLAVGILVFFMANQNETRSLSANINKIKTQRRRGRAKPESLFDRDAMYAKVENAVQILSRQKIGAIITFEKRDNLDELMKTGTPINAPVTSELLQTIFYPGTRLHDGAVIIRNDRIAAASVYYVPTTRPLTGKFGSRHRAAIGVSEISDSVTVIVSEETGRISIAYQGELQTIGSDMFLSVFSNYMSLVKEPDKD